ncbi:MAG TPA: glycogen/starch synthase, partial [Phycisphaerae bacterium]|nr:glycogen/starch synthase [Phycisphaerae bacterium]
MNIFMLGWEFPPFISGGLGTACYGLTRALNELGHHITFVLPQPVASQYTTHVRLKTPASAKAGLSYASYTIEGLQNVEFRSIPSTLQAYAAPGLIVERDPVTGELITRRAGNGGAGGSYSVLWASRPQGAGSHYGGDMFAEVQRYAQIAVFL